MKSIDCEYMQNMGISNEEFEKWKHIHRNTHQYKLLELRYAFRELYKEFIRGFKS